MKRTGMLDTKAKSKILNKIYIYTVSQKNWATFLRPITLEISNRSLPNWAQITFSLC